MALESGSLVLVNYTARIKDTGEVIETTQEEEAKKLGVHDPTKKYEPRLIAVREGWVLTGVDEAISAAEVGQKLTVEVPPDKGFGIREPNKLKMIPIRRFGEKGPELKVGDEVELENKIGIVRFVGSGRAQVDFNHRYAGKTLIYDMEIVKNIGTDLEKISALIKRRLPVEEEKLKIAIEDSTANIELPSDYYLTEGLQILKKAIANDIFKFVKSVGRTRFIESYEGPKPTEPKVPSPEQPAPEAQVPSAEQEAPEAPAQQPRVS